MRNIIPIFAVIVTSLASCQGGTEKKTETEIDSTIVTNSMQLKDATQCFQYIKNRDTATLSIIRSGNRVTGNLTYSLWEKDKNVGTIVGIVKGDTIVADYTFQSEGKNSVRQEVWLKKDEQLIEGFGDVEEVDGKTKFKSIDKLKFENILVFNKIDCK